MCKQNSKEYFPELDVTVSLCLFIVVERPTQESFTHMETSPFAGERLQNLTYMLDTYGH